MNAHAPSQGYAAIQDGSTLVIQRWLPGPVERLWRFLTESEQREKWLASGDMPLAAGASTELVWRNDRLSAAGDPRPAGLPAEQRMASHVISVDPMRHLTIAWGSGDVSFALEPRGDRVLLTLTHRGIGERGALVMIGAGWHMHLDILAARLAEAEPESFWSGWARLKEEYEAWLPR